MSVCACVEIQVNVLMVMMSLETKQTTVIDAVLAMLMREML